ncbi:hypothetical protein D1013_03260 [Euzebyella marina]|jgi:hypothetical protein|uniref:Uncharacterized protein n=1 Tax=Euzebyella marina TaxID=1761453 RepID=A0A3G2L2G4_9FLAO|nr:hypothetical protein D1013_03260 [Euzebyella marina]MAM17349.1 hypothetical protein [Christiangramia sp.]HCO85856.1 hypothetical protein [Arenibacter sp.]|tara:strand:- start:5226 stop:5435 length:210 start_codon:yes stop_codon:yes gene_type:complete
MLMGKIGLALSSFLFFVRKMVRQRLMGYYFMIRNQAKKGTYFLVTRIPVRFGNKLATSVSFAFQFGILF